MEYVIQDWMHEGGITENLIYSEPPSVSNNPEETRHKAERTESTGGLEQTCKSSVVKVEQERERQ